MNLLIPIMIALVLVIGGVFTYVGISDLPVEQTEIKKPLYTKSLSGQEAFTTSAPQVIPAPTSGSDPPPPAQNSTIE